MRGVSGDDFRGPLAQGREERFQRRERAEEHRLCLHPALGRDRIRGARALRPVARALRPAG